MQFRGNNLAWPQNLFFFSQPKFCSYQHNQLDVGDKISYIFETIIQFWAPYKPIFEKPNFTESFFFRKRTRIHLFSIFNGCTTQNHKCLPWKCPKNQFWPTWCQLLMVPSQPWFPSDKKHKTSKTQKWILSELWPIISKFGTSENLVLGHSSAKSCQINLFLQKRHPYLCSTFSPRLAHHRDIQWV